MTVDRKTKEEELIAMATLDDFAPKTRFQFPDGAFLVVGTKRDDDDPVNYGVHLVYEPEQNSEPEMSLLLPPHSVDMLIGVLQERANEARYTMGKKWLNTHRCRYRRNGRARRHRPTRQVDANSNRRCALV